MGYKASGRKKGAGCWSAVPNGRPEPADYIQPESAQYVRVEEGEKGGCLLDRMGVLCAEEERSAALRM